MNLQTSELSLHPSEFPVRPGLFMDEWCFYPLDHHDVAIIYADRGEWPNDALSTTQKKAMSLAKSLTRLGYQVIGLKYVKKTPRPTSVRQGLSIDYVLFPGKAVTEEDMIHLTKELHSDCVNEGLMKILVDDKSFLSQPEKGIYRFQRGRALETYTR